MSTLVKLLSNNRKVIFDKGRFDNWCVYIVEKEGSRYAPTDQQYFEDLARLSRQYPDHKVYKDFLQIYTLTHKYIEASTLHLIDHIADSYQKQDQTLIEQWMTVLYAGMVAEENKEYAILKKRIKHLGVYQVLILDMPSHKAANFSKGKKWRELDLVMKNYNI